MKKILLFTCLLAGFMAKAQTHEQCGADHIHNLKMANDPEYARKMFAFEAKLLQKNAQGTNSTPQYVIPVVVHVMHKGEAVGEGTNLSDEDIRMQIRVLNENFRNLNGSGTDTGIQFALAVRDPQGNCTTGINRVDMSTNAEYMANGVFRESIGISDISLKAISFWNSNQYYNIWVISELDNGSSGAVGYANFAADHGSSTDGAVVLADFFKHPDDLTTTHELGHAFNLYHTFEGSTFTSCPPQINGCGGGLGDCCTDTPPHSFDTSCDITTNICDPGNPDLSFVNNFMSYTDCQNMFTPNQKERMISALTTLRSSLLTSNGNMSLISPIQPVADFEIISGELACTESQVRLINISNCIPNTYISDSQIPGVSYNWTISNGSNTYTSTAPNPTLTIPVAGIYNITLTITTALGSDTHTKNNCLKVISELGSDHCIPQSTNVDLPFDLTVYRVQFNQIDNTTDESLNGGYENYACKGLTTVTAGQMYSLSLSTMANGATLAYSVYIDYNNNGVFDIDELVSAGHNPGQNNQTYTNNVFIPESAIKNTLLAMRVFGSGAANTITNAQVACQEDFLIGDVEDYGVYIVDEQTSGFEENAYNTITLSPNPVETKFTISGNTNIDSITIYNMLGQAVFYKNVEANLADIDITHFSAGAYIIHALAQNKTSILKILKK